MRALAHGTHEHQHAGETCQGAEGRRVLGERARKVEEIHRTQRRPDDGDPEDESKIAEAVRKAFRGVGGGASYQNPISR